MKLFKKIIKIAIKIILAIIIVVLVAVFIMKFTGNTPELFGYRVYTVVTGSMSPEIEVGDVIISKKYTSDYDIKVGDVISYIGKSGDIAGKLITHKVVSVEKLDDEIKIVTQGTANSTADPEITDKDVASVMVYKTVVISFLRRVLNNPFGFVFLYILPVVAFLAWTLYDGIRAAKAARKTETVSSPESHEENDE